MDVCSLIDKELEKLLNKLSSLEGNVVQTLDKAIDKLENIDYESYNEKSILTALDSTVSSAQKVGQQHRELHALVSKVGRTIDKHLNPPDDIMCEIDSASRVMLNCSVCDHLVRQGHLDVAETLALEACIPLDGEETDGFYEHAKIAAALRDGDLEPALQWTSNNRLALLELNSDIEFCLHRHRFLSYFQPTCELDPSKKRELVFESIRLMGIVSANTAPYKIEELMGCLLYIGGSLVDTPYSYLLSMYTLEDLVIRFSRDACRLLDLPSESPLAVCFTAGCRVLPSMVSIQKMIRQVGGQWPNNEELPVEASYSCRVYHSTLTCPILRQRTSPLNPPMRLICGHVISRDALNKIATHGTGISGALFSHTPKMKCPYCPVEQSPKDARMIIF